MPRAYGGPRMTGKRSESFLRKEIFRRISKNMARRREEIFADLSELRWLYGERADQFAAGAIGVYSYLKRIAFWAFSISPL